MSGKVGRPKVVPNDDIFIGMKMPKAMSIALSENAKLNFRARSQHILWILTDYLSNCSVPSVVESGNKPLYTSEELEDMYEDYKKRGEV